MPKKLINDVKLLPSDTDNQQVIDFGNVHIDFNGFENGTIIAIEEASFYDAFYTLGKHVKRVTQKELARIKKKKEAKKFAATSLGGLKDWCKDKSDYFTTSDGVNHLQRYLDALRGYADGSEISEDEVVWLELADDMGCQTMLLQNSKSGEVGGIHTEEDALSSRLTGNPGYGKRWVDMKVGNQRVVYGMYPGILDWGVTPTVISRNNETTFQTADYISPLGCGPLWANAAAFMFADCVEIDYVKELIGKLRDLPRPIFCSGYVLHQVFGKQPPKLLTFEIGYNLVEVISPRDVDGSIVTFGAGTPTTPDLVKRDEYHWKKRENETFNDYRLRKAEGFAIDRRKERLHEIGRSIIRGTDNVKWGREYIMDQINDMLHRNEGEWVGEWYTGAVNALVDYYGIIYMNGQGEMSISFHRHFSKGKKI